MEAKLRELGADALNGLLGEGDPDPLADNLGAVVLGGLPAAERLKDAINREGAIGVALLEVHIREYAGRVPAGLATSLLCRGNLGLRLGVGGLGFAPLLIRLGSGCAR